MSTRLQIKRSAVSNVTPTTGDIVIGELAINLADRKLFVSNGTSVYELGSNLTNLSVTGNTTLAGVIANGSLGTLGQVLHSNGSTVYWDTDDQGVTSIATGNGLTGGPITSNGTISIIANSGLSANATGVYVVPGNGLVTANSTGVHVGAGNGIAVNATAVSVLANSGIVANTTGTFVNTAFIGTLSANNSTNLNGQPATFYTNASNITTGTLATARLPATANIATVINVGANVNLTTTTISVGNTTVNVSINSTSISVTSDPLVQQSDIGTDPNQIPLNQYLGALAYQSDTIAVANVLTIGNSAVFIANGFVGIGNTSPDARLTVTGTANVSGNVVIGGSLISSNLTTTTINVGNTTVNTSVNSTAISTNNIITHAINSGPLAGFRNAIINGNFDFWQRGTSFSSPSNGDYTSDRWFVNFDGTGATRTISRQVFTLGQTDVPGEPTAFYRFNQSVAGSNGTFNAIAQRIEGVRTFAGQQVTVSFFARGAASLTMPVITLRQKFGTGGSPSANVDTNFGTSTVVGTTFTRFTFTVTIPSISGKTLGTNDNDNLELILSLPINTTFTFDLASVQIELGPVATPFERRPLGTELALCQRYFIQTTGFTSIVFNVNEFNSATFPTTMRAVPTFTLTPQTGSITSGPVVGTHGFYARVNGTVGGNYVASAEL